MSLKTASQISIAFVNCAGGARGEAPNPLELGKHLRGWGDAKGRNLVAAGVTEAVLSHPSCSEMPARFTAASVDVPPRLGEDVTSAGYLDDLALFRAGLGGNWFSYLVSNTNSADSCHPDALQRKWRGGDAVPRLRQQFEAHGNGLVVHHGMSVLLRKTPVGAATVTAVLLRPTGAVPEGNPGNDPMLYLGGRDTEPRAMLVVEAELFGAPAVIAFGQLETHTTDNRLSGPGDTPTIAVLHRKQQVKTLCRYLANNFPSEIPTVLMGDFNARVATPELEELRACGFTQVFPTGWEDSHTLNYGVPERDQSRPYSHLKHGILIDHAFCRGFGPNFQLELELVELPSEGPRERITDHRPIILTITRDG